VLRRSDQIIGEDELGPRHSIERQSSFTRLGEKTNGALRGSKEAPTEPPAPVEQCYELDLGLEAAKTIIIPRTNQWAVYARGTDLQRVGADDRVGDIKQGGDGAADLCTIIESDRQIIKPLSHDLQRCAAPTCHNHPYKTIAHACERRLDHLSDIVRVNQEPRTFRANLATRVTLAGRCRRHSHLPKTAVRRQQGA